MRKEKRVAFWRSIPKSTALAIVEPLLDIPGRIAIACTIPNTKAFEKVTFFEYH